MYAKIFASLYQGTLRGDAHGILVFTNLLAHADKHGDVDKHWRAIADETGLTVDQVRVAIARLEAPDPESRSPAHEGRRLIPLDEHRAWGWHVVNYQKYAEIRHEDDRRAQNREAQARRRQHASARVSTCQQPSAAVSKSADSQHASACVSTRQLASAESAHTDTDTDTDTSALAGACIRARPHTHAHTHTREEEAGHLPPEPCQLPGQMSAAPPDLPSRLTAAYIEIMRADGDEVAARALVAARKQFHLPSEKQFIECYKLAKEKGATGLPPDRWPDFRREMRSQQHKQRNAGAIAADEQAQAHAQTWSVEVIG